MFKKKTKQNKKFLYCNNIVNQTSLKADFYLYVECYIC